MNRFIHKSFHNRSSFFWFLVSVLIIGYFIFHSLEGSRGFFVLNAFQKEIVVQTATLDSLKGQRIVLEEKVNRLRSGSLDRDMLDQVVREKLGYVEPGEYIIMPAAYDQ